MQPLLMTHSFWGRVEGGSQTFFFSPLHAALHSRVSVGYLSIETYLDACQRAINIKAGWFAYSSFSTILGYWVKSQRAVQPASANSSTHKKKPNPELWCRSEKKKKFIRRTTSSKFFQSEVATGIYTENNHILVTFLNQGKRENTQQLVTGRTSLVATSLNKVWKLYEGFCHCDWTDTRKSYSCIKCLMGGKWKEHGTVGNMPATKAKPACKASPCYQSCFVIPYRHTKKPPKANNNNFKTNNNYAADQTKLPCFKEAKRLAWGCMVQSLNTDCLGDKRVNIVILRSKYCSF